MSVTTRPAVAADAPALAALLNQIIRIGGTTAHEEEFDVQRFTRSYLTGPAVICCHVALDAVGRPIGFQALERLPGLPEGWGDIATFVMPGLQQGGVGAALFAATRGAATAAGLRAINATIRNDNAPGLRYYSRIGFADYGAEPDYRLKDGTRVGRVLKRFDLGG